MRGGAMFRISMRLCTKSPFSGISLCNLCVLCVSVVEEFRVKPHHRDTEDTEVAQRRARSRLFVQSLSVISIFLFSFLVCARLASAQQDYIDQLIRLAELSDSQQYREAINGYKKLESKPGAPGWLKAGSEYEIAELYGELNETDNAIAALNNAVQLGFDDCLTPRTSKRLARIVKNPKATQALAAMKITEGDFR